MITVLGHTSKTLGSDKSRISFSMDGPESNRNWYRYLNIDGKKAYLLGNGCPTCSIFFERLQGANTAIQIDGTTAKLRVGIEVLDDLVVLTIGAGLPSDDYMICLLDMYVQPVRPGGPGDYFLEEHVSMSGVAGSIDLPHNPRAPYYRAGTGRPAKSVQSFQFLIPMFPESWLNKDGLESYMKAANQASHPTAVAISVLDAKGTLDGAQDNDEIDEHWVLNHYLLDGHHKVAAARQSGRSVRLRSFVSLSKGVSTRAQVEQLLSTHHA